MPRRRLGSVLVIILLGLGVPARSGDVGRFVSDEPCDAPFILSVPTEVLRANRGLSLVLQYREPERVLVVHLGLTQVVVTLRQDGRETQLAQTRATLPGDGQRVTVVRTAGGYAVGYGGGVLLRGQIDLPANGRWGTEGAPRSVLDQVLLQPTGDVFFTDDFMRTPDAPSPWESRRGDWQVVQLTSARYSVNAFNFSGRTAGPEPALATAGYWFWGDLTVEAAIQPPRDFSGFGVGLGCQPDGRAYLLRVVRGTGPAEQVQLVRVGAGRETVLARAEALVKPDDWHRLALTGLGGRLTGALDGVELVSAPAERLGPGQIALWVDGPEAVAFDDVQAYSGPRETQPPVVLSHEAEAKDPGAEAFVDDHYMKEWSDESDQWLSGGGGLWQAGYFWGDVTLTWDVPEGALKSPAQFHLDVPPESDTFRPCTKAVDGCHLELASAEGKLVLTLCENQETRAQQTIAMPELPTRISLRRAGDRLEAVVAGQVVADFTTAVPAAGKVGFTGPRARRQADRLSITSRHVIDSTFRAAPTEWTIGSGKWGVSNRWACTPRWSWFQGRSDGLASIWTRRRFTGDQVVEFFAGIPMDQPWAPFYRHPGNLAVTLCGSNDTPGSGYSLIFAGWGNSASGIFRRGELVAKVPGVVMPDILDSLGGGFGGHGEAHKLHNEWWRLRAEKMGNTIRLLVDGKVAASFTDPEPLPAGTIGIWTLKQAITVARARIFYQSSESALPPVPHPTPIAAAPAGWHAAAPGSCAVTRGPRGSGHCLEVTNPTAGGSFALATPFSEVDLQSRPLLSFDYAMPADVHVDLFATVAGQRYRVRLTGPAEPAPGVEDVGQIEVQTDGQWHSAQVDLQRLLSPYPGARRLDSLEFAAYAAPDYLDAGIIGNPAGARWRLDQVRFGAAAARVTPQPGVGSSPPDPPTLIGLPAPKVACTFETDLGSVRPWGDDAGVALRRTRNGRPDGWCLEARSTKLGGLFGIDLGMVPFDAARHPILEFDYRAPADLRVDLIVSVDGRRRLIKFTDNDQTWPVLGRIGTQTDGQWHHAMIDLYDLLTKACGREAPLVVTELAFGSSGWPGTREGLCWYLDNVRLSAAVNVNRLPEDLALRSSAAGVAWSLGDSPDAAPPARPTSTDLRQALTASVGKLVWFHAAGFDAAGIRSATSSIPLRLVAVDAPPLATPAPPAGDETLAVPIVSYVPARCADQNGFEANTGGWGDFIGSQVLRQASGGATRPGCLALRHTGRDQNSGFAVVRDFGESWHQFPVVRFRYRVVNAPGASLQMFGTTFDGERERWTPLGTFPTSGSDWQTAVVDVASRLRQAGAKLVIHRIFLSVVLPPDGVVLVDDYAMYSRVATSAAFRWSEPTAHSSIAGYSWVLDTSPDTVPPEQVLGTARQIRFDDLRPGRYVFHLRARSGAGQWGPASHVAFELAPPPPHG